MVPKLFCGKAIVGRQLQEKQARLVKKTKGNKQRRPAVVFYCMTGKYSICTHTCKSKQDSCHCVHLMLFKQPAQYITGSSLYTNQSPLLLEENKTESPVPLHRSGVE